MRYLLDTNTCIAVMRKNPLAVGRVLAVSPGDCAVSAVTSYELYTGVEKCSRPAQERAKVQKLLSAVHELPFESGAAVQAARIRADLEFRGTPIGPYDVLLAGQALNLSLILVTANTNEFSRVSGLTLENWQA